MIPSTTWVPLRYLSTSRGRPLSSKRLRVFSSPTDDPSSPSLTGSFRWTHTVCRRSSRGCRNRSSCCTSVCSDARISTSTSGPLFLPHVTSWTAVAGTRLRLGLLSNARLLGRVLADLPECSRSGIQADAAVHTPGRLDDSVRRAPVRTFVPTHRTTAALSDHSGLTRAVDDGGPRCTTARSL